MSTELAAQYPHLTAVIAPHVERWADRGGPEFRDAWIVEALDNLDAGRDDIEVAARFSVTGHPVTVDLTRAILAEVADAAQAVKDAERNLTRIVATAAHAVPVAHVADAAGITRQTAYRWRDS